MIYVILDLEWNGAYSKKLRRHINEIIEIGAVQVEPGGGILRRFSTPVNPVIDREISRAVSSLTGLEPEELAGGYTFAGALSGLRKWIGKEGCALLTWSRSDLDVLLDSCRYFQRLDRIPFMQAYADLQDYAGNRLGIDKPSLDAAAETLGLARETAHRALEDCRMTAAIFEKLYDPEAFAPYLRPADDDFYAQLNFHSHYILDINDPAVSPADLAFRCDTCGQPLTQKTDWVCRYHGPFYTEMLCENCGLKYEARVQWIQMYGGVKVKKRLKLKEEDDESCRNAKT